MDGVLADFDKFVLDNMGRTFDHQSGPADRDMWDFLSSVDRMYFNLPPTPYALDLIALATSLTANVEILTAIPRRTKMLTAEQDKRDWMEKYFSEHNLKVNIGPYSRDKWKHAKPNDILVDDRIDNIDDWVNLGNGIGIFHVYDDIQTTLNLLRTTKV